MFEESFAEPSLYVAKPVRESDVSFFSLALFKYLVQKGEKTFKVFKVEHNVAANDVVHFVVDHLHHFV